MPSTANYAWPTPALTGVTPDVPRDLQDLADEIDADLKTEETTRVANDKGSQGSRTHAAATSIPNSAWTSIPFDTVDLDEIPWSAGSKVWTVAVTGYYQINAGVFFALNATGHRDIRIFLNGTTSLGTSTASDAGSGYGTGAVISRGKKLTAGDTIAIQCFQTSGGSLALLPGTAQIFGDITLVGLA